LYVVNTDCSGGGTEGSANAPTATPISCGMRSGCQNTVDPHAEQKWKITSFPVSELRVKVFEAPLTTVTALRSNEAAMLNKLPVRRRQSRQWHIETRRFSLDGRIAANAAANVYQHWLSEWCAREAMRLATFYRQLGIAGFA
jgi:hypothetical protein